MMAALSNRIHRHLCVTVAFTLIALVLVFFLTGDVSHPELFLYRKHRSSPPLKCAPPERPERPWQKSADAPEANPASSSSSSSTTGWEFQPGRDGDNYGLSREQCSAAFPKLFVEIDKAVDAREGKSISFQELDSREMGNGEVRALIHDGQLYVLDYKDMPFTFSRASATLNALNRALTAVPEPQRLPNIEFIFSSHDDSPGPHPVWVYSKRDEDTDVWLMPDFGYWSWPETNVGAYRDVRRRIAAVDNPPHVIDDDDTGTITHTGLPFRKKQKQLLWRGNVDTAPELRGRFLAATADKPWASVREIHWQDKENVERNFVPIEDHCRYMFLAHVEGRSYSGRGKYLQNCRSVFVAHDLRWREAHHAALVDEGPDANYVRVDRDFSDLEEKIEHLLENPEEAERIAANGVRVFRDRYLTPAAEACYWRELIRAYGAMCDFEPLLEAVDEQTGKMVPRGMPFESFTLNGELSS